MGDGSPSTAFDPGGAGEKARPRLRGVSHQVAAFAFPPLGLVAMAAAGTARARLAVAVYTVGVTAMYATSAVYHRGRWTPATRRRLRRVDHSMILVGTAATYTPIVAIGLRPSTARPLLAVVWVLALAGVLIRNMWLGAPRWLVAAVYMAVGWVAVGVLPALWAQLGVVTFALVLAGGTVYSLGALVYSRRRPDPVPGVFGFHEVFHALVLVAGLIFYVVIVRVVARS